MDSVYIFIDAANVWDVQKSQGRWFDYEKLKSFLKKEFNPAHLEIFYYSAYPADGTRDYNLDSKHKFFTFLKKGAGFNVRTKPLKRIKEESSMGEYITEKGDMDIEVAIDAIHNKDKYETAVFFTGDSDFLSLITYLRNRGKKVYVFSPKNNISTELRTGADGYSDILKLNADIWGKELKHRKSRGDDIK